MAWVKRRRSGYLVCWREDGRERSRSVATEAEAAELKAAIEAEQNAARVLAGVPGIPGWDGGVMVGEALETEFAFATYLRRLIEQDGELRESVRDTYLSGLRNHIEGTPFGRADIRAIGPDVVEAFWATVTTNRRNIYQLLAKAFNAAVRAEVIPSTPLRRAHVKRPSTRVKPEDRPLTVDELERLAAGAREPRARLAILLMGFCGLRAGEVGGLRVQDVSGSRLSIRQAVVQTRRTKYLSPPKTRAARRSVAVPPSIASELAGYVAEHQPAIDGRLFHRGNGELWGHQSINSAVQKGAKRAGLPPVHSHQLRHTAVSLLIDDGANPKAIQTFVGHADIRETLGTYGHLFDHGGAALAASMERRREQHRNGGTG
jgi:integrase